MTHHVYCDVLLNRTSVLLRKIARNIFPAKRKLGLFFPGAKNPLIRIALIHALLWILEELWEHWRSKSEGAASRFRKSEIRTRGGWSDVIKLVTSRCVFNGPYCALFLKRSEYRSRWFSHFPWIIARIHGKWDRKIDAVGKGSLASAFLAVINKNNPFLFYTALLRRRSHGL